MKIKTEYNIGDKVHDDLTNKVGTVIGLRTTNGIMDNGKITYNTICYNIEFVSGCRDLRYAWEIDKVDVINKDDE